MQVVIDIPDETIRWVFEYASFIKGFNGEKIGIIANAIKNGVPLPKGHGRLIDADETLKAMDTWDKFGYLPHDLIRLGSENGLKLIPYIHYDDVVKCVTNMPTILNAYKEVKDVRKSNKCNMQ